MSDEFKFYSVEELAQIIGVSEAWVYRQCQAHAIPHHRFGRQYRFTPQNVRDLTDQTAVAVTADKLVPTGGAHKAR